MPPLPSRRLVRRFALSMLVLVGLLLLVHFALDAWSRHRVAEATREHGEVASLDWTDFIPPELSEGPPNGSDYLEATSLLVEGQHLTYQPVDGDPDPDLAAVKARFSDLDANRARPDAHDLALFRQVVERFELPLDVLDEGVWTATEARYRANYDTVPLEIQIPNLLTRLRFAALLRARAEIAIAEGRTEDAWYDAAAVFRLAHWVGEELWTLINTLIARAIAEDGASLVQALLAEPPVPELLRDAVLAEARRVDPAVIAARSLDAERAATWASLLDPRIEGNSLEAFTLVGHDHLPDTFLARRGHIFLENRRWWWRLNAAAYLDRATPRYESCKQPTYQRESPPLASFPGWARIANLVTFQCDDFAVRMDLWRAFLDQLEIAFALEAIREETGTYPDDLGDAGAGFVDPITGEPYRYRREDAGYRLWSVGTNREDDDGALPPAETESGRPAFSEGDQVWLVAPP